MKQRAPESARLRRAPESASWDVWLMNTAAWGMLACVLAAGVAAVVMWALESPALAIGRITVDGDVEHNSAASLQANIVPLLKGNFVTLEMAQAQAAFESAPWVRRAVVRRELPNLLHVTLQEHVPVAYWGDDGRQLVNTQGEIFDGQENDDRDDDDAPAGMEADAPLGGAAAGNGMPPAMPRLNGPQGRAPEVLAMYWHLAPLLKPLGLRMQGLTLLERGNWRARLDQGATLELGAGTPKELAARLSQFAATAREVAARHQRPPQAILSADLRHAGGYALRLQGISTTRGQP